LRIAHYIGRIYKLRKERIQQEIIQADLQSLETANLQLVYLNKGKNK
jgi:hypothetical protein